VKQTIKPGAEFDFTTPDEMKEHLNIITAQSAQERARGVQPWRGEGVAGVSDTDVQIPALGSLETIGTDPGWAAYVYTARAQGLSGSDVLKIYRVSGGVGTSSAVDLKFVGQCTVAAPVQSFGSRGLLLKGAEQLIFVGSGLSATGDVSVNAEGTQLPETDLYKAVTS
jgi:hypothetical protein